MNKTEMERELLLGDSIVAFTGAVFWAISGRPLFGRESLSQGGSTLTDFLAYFYVAIGAALMILALLLALGSMLPLLRSGASSLAMRFSPILKIITLVGLVLSWNSVANELPQDQWWYDYLFYIGLLIVFSLCSQCVAVTYEWTVATAVQTFAALTLFSTKEARLRFIVASPTHDTPLLLDIASAFTESLPC